MSDEIKVTWEVDDGYVGKNSFQYTYIDREEYEECETDEEKENLVISYVEEDFQNNITFSIVSVI